MQTIFNDMPHTELRYVDNYNPHSIIYTDTIIILDLQDTSTAFVIPSQNITTSHKHFFDDTMEPRHRRRQLLTRS